MSIVALEKVKDVTQELIAELENSLEKVIVENQQSQQQNFSDASTQLAKTLTDHIDLLQKSLEDSQAKANADLENILRATIEMLNQVLNDDTHGAVTKWSEALTRQLTSLDEMLSRHQAAREKAEEEQLSQAHIQAVSRLEELNKGIIQPALEKLEVNLNAFSTQAEERQAKADAEADARAAKAHEDAVAREEKAHEQATSRLHHLQNKIVNPGFDRLEEATDSLSRKFVRAVLLLMILTGLMVLALTTDSTLEALSSNDTARIIAYVFFLFISLIVIFSRGVLNSILGIKER